MDGTKSGSHDFCSTQVNCKICTLQFRVLRRNYFCWLQLSEDVARKKSEYQKYLELYKLMRSRFEEHYVKCKFLFHNLCVIIY